MNSQQDSPIARLKPMLNGVVPISDQERQSRIDKAQRLMAQSRRHAMVSTLTIIRGLKGGRPRNSS